MSHGVVLIPPTMEYYCEHCHRYRNGAAYRVTSEEFGLARLDMIVCYECYLVARRLSLRANKMGEADSVTERATHSTLSGESN